MTTGKAMKRKEPLKKSMVQGIFNAVLSQMGTEQLRKVLRSSLATRLYAKKDVQIVGYIINIFCYRDVTVSECVVSGTCERITLVRIGRLC